MTNLTQPQLKTIRVYGTLAKLLKRRTFQAVVRSPLDAINFLLSNFPELQTYIEPRAFQIIVNDKPINEHQLATPVDLSADKIHIIPAICGAGGDNNTGLISILTGAALIGASFLFPFAAPVLLPLGIGLVLTGAAALIAPVTPENEDRSDPSSSYIFNGVQNTSREGVAVPCVYGEIVTGSVTISLGIIEDEEEIDTNFEGGTGNPNPQIIDIFTEESDGPICGETVWVRPGFCTTAYLCGDTQGRQCLNQDGNGNLIPPQFSACQDAVFTTVPCGKLPIRMEVVDPNFLTQSTGGCDVFETDVTVKFYDANDCVLNQTSFPATINCGGCCLVNGNIGPLPELVEIIPCNYDYGNCTGCDVT